MRIGDRAENAIWLSGRETEQQINDYEKLIEQSILTLCIEHGFIPGPIHRTVKRPGEDSVPQVPDHISGPNVRLLVFEADVVAVLPNVSLQAH